MDIKPEILTSPSFFLKTAMSDIEQTRRLRARVEAMTPEQQKALLAILTQSRENGTITFRLNSLGPTSNALSNSLYPSAETRSGAVSSISGRPPYLTGEFGAA